MSVKRVIYDELVQRHQDAIFRYALVLLRNRADAEDVCQEVLVRMWRHMGAFQLLKAKSWIMRVTHHQCVDVIRRRDSAANREVLVEPDVLAATVAAGDLENPARVTANRQLHDHLEAAIQALPDRLRSVFTLYELQGMKCAQVAGVLDMKVSTVKVYLMRARTRLRQELKEVRPDA